MKIVKPSALLYGPVPTAPAEALKFIEQCGRLCYKSEDKITDTSAAPFVKRLVKAGHLAMVEHSNFVVRAANPGMFAPSVGKYLNVFKDQHYIYVGGNLTAWLNYANEARIFSKPFLQEYKELFSLPDCTTYSYSAWQVCPHAEIPTELHRYSAKFICDRGVTHELVRHRPCSFCLSGDTVLRGFSKSTANGSKAWTIKQLYDWQADAKRSSRVDLIRLRSMNSDGVLTPGKIKQILFSGIKEVYKLTTLGNKTLVASKDHRIHTPEGWKTLGELKIGSRITANGVLATLNKEWLHQKYIVENNTRAAVANMAGCCEATLYKAFKKFGIVKPWADRPNRRPGHGNPGMHSEAEKKNISERMTKENNPRWKGEQASPQSGRSRLNRWTELPDKCWGCMVSKNVERHHLDSNPLNNTPENILPLCRKCHKSFHAGQGVMSVYSDQVVSIEPIGQCPTYDIEMAGPHHNFVAGGIVVHNSQESTRYVNYGGKDMEFIEPWWCKDAKEHHKQVFRAQCLQAELSYGYFLAEGHKPQQARAVLPNALKTEIIVTADAAEWRHIFKLRTALDAHPDMRRVMIPLREEFKQKYPEAFE